MKCKANEPLLYFFPVAHTFSEQVVMFSCLGFIWFVSSIFFSAVTATFLKLLLTFNHFSPPSWLIAAVLQRIFCTPLLIFSSPTLLWGLQTLSQELKKALLQQHPATQSKPAHLTTVRRHSRPLLPAHLSVLLLSDVSKPCPFISSSHSSCPKQVLSGSSQCGFQPQKLRCAPQDDRFLMVSALGRPPAQNKNEV